MWARRTAALVLAVALVAGAFVIRDRRSTRADAGPGADPTTAGAGPGTTARRGRLVVVCATELRAACEGDLGVEADVRVETAGATAAALAGAADARGVLDVWVTVDPWPALADDRRTAAGAARAFPADVAPLAHSPVGVAVRTPRDAVLAAACGGPVTLTCVGEKGGTVWSTIDAAQGASWGTFKPAITDPLTSATGAAALVAAVRDQRRDQGVELIDLRNDAGFQAWVRNLVRPTATTGETALQRAITRLEYDAVVLPQAELAATAGASSRFAFAGATFAAEVVAVAPSGAAVPAKLVSALTGRLTAAGWLAGAATTERLGATLVAGIQQAWKETS